ncbi:hypothetical protein [Vibrio panuliri]|uniref:DUF2946 domain-containing protein n=1 Tax=Vibrio panuliri TaxID=1381081 RepID=A0ABX3FF96_9VIBR|nr:hypothetical protein [Vibrio panuliri]KAB1457831.1 hypothetical protein F7O85_08865 [Vibrio panuliri]OLQ91069.1 hypothetical protein BIY20_10010 [Vibrio panuliri]
MFSQSLTAQLTRMVLLLGITLVAVHHCEPLLELLAQQAVDMGCHQNSGSEEHSSHLHHH